MGKPIPSFGPRRENADPEKQQAKLIEQFEGVRQMNGDLSLAGNLLAQVVEVTFATGADVAAVGTPFPLNIPLRKGFLPLDFRVARIEDMGNPNAIFFSGVFASWRPFEGGVRLLFLSGLTSNTRYRVRFIAQG